jgi:hypothetical protein
MSEGKDVLICLACADCEPEVESFVDACADCHRALWHAYSSPEVDIVLCPPCCGKRIEREGARIEPPTKKQLGDLRRWRALNG